MAKFTGSPYSLCPKMLTCSGVLNVKDIALLLIVKTSHNTQPQISLLLTNPKPPTEVDMTGCCRSLFQQAGVLNNRCSPVSPPQKVQSSWCRAPPVCAFRHHRSCYTPTNPQWTTCSKKGKKHRKAFPQCSQRFSAEWRHFYQWTTSFSCKSWHFSVFDVTNDKWKNC